MFGRPKETVDTRVKRLLSKATRNERGCLVARTTGRYKALKGLGLAHRVVWQHFNNRSAAGMCVCHRCDNTRCVNPEHLFLGTMADNMADRDAKGRNGTLGEDSPLAKLTAEKVLAIWEQVASRPASLIAAEFGVNEITVHRIAKGQTWKHLFAERKDTK